MSLETATFVNDLVITNPLGSDPILQGDDHLRIVKSVLKTTFPNSSKALYFADAAAKTAVFTIVATEDNKTFACSTAGGSYAANLPSLVAGDAGFKVYIFKTTSDANTVTVTPASGTINGSATLVLSEFNDYCIAIWTGTTWLGVTVPQLILLFASTTEALTGTDTTKIVTPDALAALWEKGSDIASAATISIGEGGIHHVTGTTGISDIDFATAKDGRPAVLIFDGILVLTHSATLPLEGSANITTAAGDIMFVWQDSGDTVKAHFVRTDGTALVSSGGVTVIKKASDQSVASTTLTNDTDFTFALAASTKYIVEIRLDTTHTLSESFKFDVTGPASPTAVTINATPTEISTTSEAQVATVIEPANAFSSSMSVFMANASVTGLSLLISIFINNGTNAGTFQFRWANVSTATSRTVKARSWMSYQVVN